MIICAGAKIIGSKIILGTTDYRMGTDKLQGYAWASQAGDALSNPFASELARDYEIYRSFCYANGPAFCASRKNLLEKITGCAWFPSGEML